MMNAITHHPTEETLAAFAAGTLDEARGLVVSMHLSLCAACSGKVAAYEAIGGELLDQAPPVSLAPGALQNVLRLINKDSTAQDAAPEEPLGRYRLGP